MERRYPYTQGQPPEVTSMDARIADAGGTSSRIELQHHRLRQAKTHDTRSIAAQLEDLVRENGYLRQEIAFYQESRNAMLAFHHQTLQSFHMMQSALRELSDRMALAEGRLERYWGIPLNGAQRSDVTVL